LDLLVLKLLWAARLAARTTALGIEAASFCEAMSKRYSGKPDGAVKRSRNAHIILKNQKLNSL